MELETLLELMERFSRSDLTALEWRRGEDAVVLKREAHVSAALTVPPAPAPIPAAEVQPEPREDGELVTAPLVGTFYAAPSPEEAPFVTPGQQVTKGQVLCIIEAMKMMSEITADWDGTVTEILAENGQAVGYGAPLLRLRRT